MVKFHTGELLAQELAGAREHVASNGYEEFIRHTMPAQHQLFFETQPILYLASAGDQDQRIWASAVVGRPGFIRVDGGETMAIPSLRVVHGDPLALNLAVGAKLGALGLELHTRRRNRLNVHVKGVQPIPAVAATSTDLQPPLSVSLGVDLSFGNCPKYIQARDLHFDWEALEQHVGRPVAGRVQGGTRLGAAQRRMVRAADTFFLATGFSGQHVSAGGGVPSASVGLDMSHRGGAPGFVVLGRSQPDREGPDELRWADFAGNNMYQSIGNLLLNSRAGLLFIDYATGDTLQLTGTCRVDYEDTSLPGAQRVMRFELEQYIHTPGALPFRQKGAIRPSPYNPPAPALSLQAAEGGDEAQQPGQLASADAPADQQRHSEAGGVPSSPEQALQCVSIQDAADGIKTFEFNMPGGATYFAGQYATFQFPGSVLAPGAGEAAQHLQRTWTVSSHPAWSARSGTFTITVKRAGRISGWLHDSLREGDRVLFRGFGGDFTPALLALPAAVPAAAGAGPCQHTAQASSSGPQGVLLLAGGIGITPMRPILEELITCAAAAAAARATSAVGPGDSAAALAQPAKLVVALGLWVQHLGQAALTRELHDIAELAAGVPGVDVRLVLLTTQEAPDAGAGHAGLGHSWRRSHGRMSVAALRRDLLPAAEGADGAPLQLVGWHAFVCGPPGFMLAAEQALEGVGLSPALVHTESFNY